jgi:type II secretory pathway component PulF
MSRLYHYRAVDASGRSLQGHIEAASPADALARLRARAAHPISVEAVADGRQAAPSRMTPAAARPASKPDGFKPLKARPAELFIRQLSRMLKAGLTLDRTLSILAAREGGDAASALAHDLRARLRSGATVANAFAAHPKSFDRSVLALIGAGDAAGRLPAAFADIEQMLGARGQLTSRLRSAMIYPAILTMVAIGSVLTILLFVIPKFKDLVAGQGDALPFMSRLVFALSDMMVASGWLIGILGALAVTAMLHAASTGALERRIMDGMSRLPGIGPALRDGSSARMLRLLGTQLGCNVALTEAIASTASIASGPRERDALELIRTRVRGGVRLSLAMRESRLFPESAVQLCEVGEETGDAGGMLSRAAELLEEDADRAVKRIFIVFEPMLLVILGLVIGGLLYGLFSAILTLNQAVL